MPQISVVIPVLNEQDSLEQLHREISQVAERQEYDLEVIFVDDGSTDETWNVMAKLAENDPRVKCLQFRRNFGKAAALSAGAAVAMGQVVITMDGDLQDDPAEFPHLLAKMDDGYDVVSGWKKNRLDPWHKTIPSKFFNRMVSWFSGVKLHDHNCGLKSYRRAIFDEIQLYGERHRFIPMLAANRGWNIGEIVVNHRARTHGVSKYNWRRLPKGFLDILTISFLTSYNHRPQHLLGGAGLLSFGAGAVGLVWMAIYWVLRICFFPDWEPVHRRPLVLYSLGAFLLGAQLLCMGFLAELIIANSLQQSGERPYSIGRTIGIQAANHAKTSTGSSMIDRSYDSETHSTS